MSIGRYLPLAAVFTLWPVFADAQSWVRFVNAAPEQLQSISITIDGAEQREIEYGRTTPRLSIPEGERMIKATTGGQNPVVLTQSKITFQKDKYYTVTVTGELVEAASYAITSTMDDDTDPKDRLRVRYGLLAKEFKVGGATVVPDLHVVCDGAPDIRVTGTPLKFTPYVEKTVTGWSGALCRVTLEVQQNSVWVPVWQDLSNYYFSPHTIYTIASVGADPATVVLIRETDNK